MISRVMLTDEQLTSSYDYQVPWQSDSVIVSWLETMGGLVNSPSEQDQRALATPSKVEATQPQLRALP